MELLRSIWAFAVTTCSDPSKCDVNLPGVGADDATIKVILRLVFGVLGALAVFFVILGGFRYVISTGDPQGISKAKSTIIYALIGLVIAIMANVIVNFVIGNL